MHNNIKKEKWCFDGIGHDSFAGVLGNVLVVGVVIVVTVTAVVEVIFG